MSTTTMDMNDGSSLPKRGDLLYSAVGTPRQRVWIVIHVHKLKPMKAVPRGKIWMERWWEIEPELRMQLYRSAERNGGQRAVFFKRYPSKKSKPCIPLQVFGYFE